MFIENKHVKGFHQTQTYSEDSARHWTLVLQSMRSRRAHALLCKNAGSFICLEHILPYLAIADLLVLCTSCCRCKGHYSSQIRTFKVSDKRISLFEFAAGIRGKFWAIKIQSRSTYVAHCVTIEKT